jgi:hypothetical protein
MQDIPLTMKTIISRNFEMIMGLVGSVIGIFSGSFLIFLQSVGKVHTPFLGIVAILASVLGLASTYYVNKHTEMAGIGFILATMFVIVGSDYINIISAIFLLVAGVSALFRN